MESESKEIAAASGRRRRARRAYFILAAVALAALAIWFVHRELTQGKESTDDAQVDADVVPIAPRVGGVVRALHVKDHQLVHAGEVLLEIDPADLDIEVARAQAELEAARAQETQAQSQVEVVESSSKGGLSSARAAVSGAGASVRGAADAVRSAEAAVARARAERATADADWKRAQDLFAQEAITQRELERAQQAHDVAVAASDAANAQLQAAREQQGLAQSRVVEAQGRLTQSAPVDRLVASAQAAAALATARVEAAQVALDKAKLQRSYATLVAPTTGLVSRVGAHVGQTVGAGQSVMMLVPTETYVMANFKETQVGRMKPGNAVDIELDAYPGRSFEGVVDSLSPGTGARFSLLPPDNATGNFVKVVQRVPVKIAWRHAPADVGLRPGLSANVTVHVE